jgi:AmiR/NasT family two-component response regulator
MSGGYQLRDLRNLAVTVLHPDDDDARIITGQLGRIGCRTEQFWPPPRSFRARPDVVFVTVDRDRHAATVRLLKRAETPQPAVIAVVDYENPAMLQLMLELDAQSVLNRPVRSFGILTSLVLARSHRLHTEELRGRIERLEARLLGLKNVDKAKKILMTAQGIDEEAAYRSMRARAMSKRMSVEEMALAIIHAHELLNSSPDDA